jgi:hypothetical protein
MQGLLTCVAIETRLTQKLNQSDLTYYNIDGILVEALLQTAQDATY